MIVILLLIIIAILLFGASAVLGVAGMILWAIVAFILFAYVLASPLKALGIVALIGASGAALVYFKMKSGDPDTSPQDRARYVWGLFSHALEGRLSPEDRARVDLLIRAGDDQQLNRFCNDEVRRLYPDNFNAVLRGSAEQSIGGRSLG